MTALDPISLSLVQNRLDHIAKQMGWVMIRTSRSPIFNQSHDFSCFLTDAQGMLVSQADGLPIHTGGGGFAIRALIGAFGGRIKPGDAFILSDPYAAGGNHLPDWVVARPVFAAQSLIAFACNRAHQSDIGGGAAGTYNSAATEIFHEGIRLPPVRLVDGGTIRDDVWQLLLLNTRCPELLDGDLRAMLGSTEIGAQQLVKLVSEFGVERTKACFEGVLDHADRLMRQAVKELPDGTYRSEEGYASDCFKPTNARIRLNLTIIGDRLIVDFAGTDPQVRGFTNSSLANTHSAVYAAVSAFLDSAIPRNEGTFRCIEVNAPLGTIVNAKPPAPVGACTTFPAEEIIHCCWWALGQAAPERNCAGWGKNSHPNTANMNRDGSVSVLYHWSACPGAGAVNSREGFNVMGPLCTLGGLSLPNAEAYEQFYPVQVVKQEFVCDGGGAGTYRGGTGIDYEVVIESPAEYSFRGGGLGPPSGLGVEGGRHGKPATMTVREHDGVEQIPPPYGQWQMGPSVLRMTSPGGGGYGDPLWRDPHKVLRDARDGVVSLDAAREVYGVAIAKDGRSFDPVETARMRSAAQQRG